MYQVFMYAYIYVHINVHCLSVFINMYYVCVCDIVFVCLFLPSEASLTNFINYSFVEFYFIYFHFILLLFSFYFYFTFILLLFYFYFTFILLLFYFILSTQFFFCFILFLSILFILIWYYFDYATQGKKKTIQRRIQNPIEQHTTQRITTPHNHVRAVQYSIYFNYWMMLHYCILSYIFDLLLIIFP